MRQLKHENLLRKIAARSTHRTFHHASLVTKGGAIKSYGYNHGELHAEHVALNKLWPNHRVGVTVINIRIRRNGTLGMAKPCEKCLTLMFNAGCGKVLFSNEHGKFNTIILSTQNYLKGFKIK